MSRDVIKDTRTVRIGDRVVFVSSSIPTLSSLDGWEGTVVGVSSRFIAVTFDHEGGRVRSWYPYRFSLLDRSPKNYGKED